jgi:hypothetical protein
MLGTIDISVDVQTGLPEGITIHDPPLLVWDHAGKEAVVLGAPLSRPEPVARPPPSPLVPESELELVHPTTSAAHTTNHDFISRLKS